MRHILIWLIPVLLLAKETAILVIHSYSHEYAWTHKQNDGFVAALKTDIPDTLTIETEYLNTKRLEPDSDFLTRYRDFLAYKYTSFHPDAIYVTDDNALKLIRFVKTSLFKDIPVFFSGINNLNMIRDNTRYAGAFEKKDIKTNLALIRRLLPDKKELLILGDGSPTFALIKDQVKELLAKESFGFTIRYGESDELAKLHRTIAMHPKAVVLLTTIGKVKTEEGKPLPLESIINSIATATRQPLFCMEDAYIHPRIIGGYVTSGSEHGKKAATLLFSYLKGTPMQELKSGYEGTNAYLFSDEALHRFGIVLPREIEESATLLFKEKNFFQQHEELIYLILYTLFILLFVGMLLFSVFILKKNRLIDRYSKTLKKSEKRLRDMFDKHSAVMLLIDPSTSRILDANEAAAAFYGYPVPQLKQMLITDINVLDEKKIHTNEQQAAARKSNYFIFKHRLANGGVRDVEVHSTPILFENHKILFSIIHDITEVVEYRTNLEKRVEEEIEKRRRHEQLMIQQSKLAAMGEMINAIAHQWRQPLNALGLLIQDLPDAYNYGEINLEYLEHMVEDSIEQIAFMSATIDDFRDFFRPNRRMNSFNVKATIREVFSIIDAQLRTHNITYRINGEDYRLLNHHNEFKQVILNLLNNAKDAIIQHSESGHIDVLLSQDDTCDQIIVKDSGGGIPEAIKERIFEPYFTTKEQGKGTGIGLYIVKTILEEHMNASVTVSTVDGGAEFVIRFNKMTKNNI